MTIAEATSDFLDYAGQNSSPVHTPPESAAYDNALRLLTEYFSADAVLSQVTSSRLRDFLSRWYIEKASSSKAADSAKRSEADQVTEAHHLLASLTQFFKWVDQQEGGTQSSNAGPILFELRHSLARAVEITDVLTRSLRERRGAFNFPEFLTSFEEGGSSQYDIDTPGNIGAIDGYFRIVRVENTSVEAEELISEARVGPIVFPAEVASLLDTGYIINLELVREPEGWQIAGCGFAYPPGTEI